MPEVFYNILTTLGLNALANAQATQTPLPLIDFAVGDSNVAYYEPVVGQVSLVNEVWRGSINRVYVSPNDASHIVVEALIPADAGGFNIREAGVFDGVGNLIAVGKYPLTFKPALGSGSEKDLYVRMIMQVTNAANVSQSIDPTLVYLTQWHLDAHADRLDNPHAVTVAQIGAETPAGAQAKVDTHRDVAAPHSGHETPAGAQAKVNAHSGRTDNPHAVTVAQIGAETPSGAQDKVNTLLPAGTRMVFVQAAAPTGWTQVTGMEGRGLRLVDASGGGLGGGSDAFATHSHTVGAHGHGHTLSAASHALTIAEMPSHMHSITTKGGITVDNVGSYVTNLDDGSSAPSPNTDYAGSSAGHLHGITGAISNSASFNSGSFSPKYVNSIVCSKD